MQLLRIATKNCIQDKNLSLPHMYQKRGTHETTCDKTFYEKIHKVEKPDSFSICGTLRPIRNQRKVCYDFRFGTFGLEAPSALTHVS